jgi:hypothetical protein
LALSDDSVFDPTHSYRLRIFSVACSPQPYIDLVFRNRSLEHLDHLIWDIPHGYGGHPGSSSYPFDYAVKLKANQGAIDLPDSQVMLFQG